MIFIGVEAEREERWVDQGCGLFPFIQKCLRNPTRYCNIIKWTNKEDKEFKIIDPEKLATMWGMEKRKDGMTKRKLTRSLAYLVNVKAKLQRTSTRTFIYKIVDNGVPMPGSPPSSPQSNDDESNNNNNNNNKTQGITFSSTTTEATRHKIPIQTLKKICLLYTSPSPRDS